jgi:16S rRNA processing protein RimM
VADEAGTELGTVVEVFRAGENEVYRVEAEGQPDLLLPALREVVRSIDLGAGTMTVRYESEEVR